MPRIPALNHNRKIIPMWINSAMTLKLGTMSITKTIEYKQLVEKIRRLHKAEKSARGTTCTKRKSNTYIMEDKEMSTEILGYMARPQTVSQKPTERTQAKRSIMDIQIPDAVAKTLISVIMLELSALSIPMADGDCTAALMVSFLVIANLIGGWKK